MAFTAQLSIKQQLAAIRRTYGSHALAAADQRALVQNSLDNCVLIIERNGAPAIVAQHAGKPSITAALKLRFGLWTITQVNTADFDTGTLTAKLASPDLSVVYPTTSVGRSSADVILAGDASDLLVQIAGEIDVWSSIVPPATGGNTGGANYGTAALPFAASSAWNAPIAANATYEAANGAQTAAFLNAGVIGFNTVNWSIPKYQAVASDPFRTIKTGPGWSGISFSREGEFIFQCPANAVPSPQLDAHFACVDPTGTWVFEFWYCYLRNGVWTASSGVQVPLNSSGTGINASGGGANPAFPSPNNKGAGRAYGGSIIAGLLCEGDLDAPLNHALAIALPRSVSSQTYILPATTGSQASDITGIIPQGTRFAIPRSINLASYGFPTAVYNYALGLQNHGLIHTDVSGSPCAYGEQTRGIALANLLNSYSTHRATLHSMLRRVL